MKLSAAYTTHVVDERAKKSNSYNNKLQLLLLVYFENTRLAVLHLVDDYIFVQFISRSCSFAGWKTSSPIIVVRDPPGQLNPTNEIQFLFGFFFLYVVIDAVGCARVTDERTGNDKLVRNWLQRSYTILTFVYILNVRVRLVAFLVKSYKSIRTEPVRIWIRNVIISRVVVCSVVHFGVSCLSFTRRQLKENPIHICSSFAVCE